MSAKKPTLKTIPAKAAPLIVPDVIAIALDREEKKVFKTFKGTEAELVRKACLASGFSPEALARRALLIEASRLLSTASSGKDGQGIAGSADDRLRIAYNALVKSGAKKITPTIVAMAADPPSTYRTAVRWFEIHGIDSVKINAGKPAGASERA